MTLNIKVLLILDNIGNLDTCTNKFEIPY